MLKCDDGILTEELTLFNIVAKVRVTLFFVSN
jgi:hypothetical protein